MASSATGSNQRSWYHLHARFGSIQLLSFALILTEFAVFFSLSISYLISNSGAAVPGSCSTAGQAFHHQYPGLAHP